MEYFSLWLKIFAAVLFGGRMLTQFLAQIQKADSTTLFTHLNPIYLNKNVF